MPDDHESSISHKLKALDLEVKANRRRELKGAVRVVQLANRLAAASEKYREQNEEEHQGIDSTAS